MLVIGEAPESHERLAMPEFDRGSSLRQIQDSGVLRVGAMLDLPNFAYRNPATGRIDGLEVEFVRQIARHLFGDSGGPIDDRIEFFEGTAGALEDRLSERDVDVVICNFADTKRRRRTMSFAGHYLSSSHTAFVGDPALDVLRPEDLNGALVAVGDGSTDVSTLLQVAPQAVPLCYPTASDCIRAVCSGAAQAYWTTRANFPGYSRMATIPLRQAGFYFTSGEENWAVGVPKNDHDDSFEGFVDDVVAGTLRSGVVSKWLSRSYTSPQDMAEVTSS